MVSYPRVASFRTARDLAEYLATIGHRVPGALHLVVFIFGFGMGTYYMFTLRMRAQCFGLASLRATAIVELIKPTWLRAGSRSYFLKLVVCGLYAALLLVVGVVQASKSPLAPQAARAEESEVAKLLGTLEQEQWADCQVPQAAAHKLAEMGGPAVRPIFQAMLESNSNRALYWMEYALYRMADQYAARRDEAEFPLAIFMATLDNRREPYDLRRLAARLLGKLGDARAVTALRNNLSDRRVALEAARSLGQIKTASSRRELVSHLAVVDQELKLEIIGALGQLGDIRALPALERLAASRTPEVRAAAVGAMVRIWGPRTLTVLTQMAEREVDTQVRQSLRLGFLQRGQPLPPRLAQCPIGDIKTTSCQGCHAQLYSDFLASDHKVRGRLTCITCHSKSVRHQVSYGSQPPEQTYAGATVAALCAQCHQQMDLPSLERAPSGRLRHTFSYLNRIRAGVSTSAPGETPTYVENFERGTAFSWEPVNPEDWSVLRNGANHVYALTRPFSNGVPRRPIQISLLKKRAFADFTFTVRVRRPDPTMGSLVLLFGYQDETHFYYAHLSEDSSSKTLMHNGLFIVDGAPRRRIGTAEAAAILPDTDWHRIRIVREVTSGRMALYVDDVPQAVLEAIDHRFQWGQIGLGSFHEVGYFDDVTVTGTRTTGGK
jgi:hypothetical protein